MVKVKENLKGRVFGRLKVIQQVEDYINPQGKHRAQWLCECNCEEHNQIIVEGTNLKRGNTQSCGCWQKERATEDNKKYNKYNLSGEYGVGWTSNTNREFYFDLEDYYKIKDYCWYECVVGSSRNFHILQATELGERECRVRMHQVLGFSNYDHIDRNEFNNRKSNLRPCTRSQNQMNCSLRSHNTSGVTGVSPTKDGYWEASLKAGGEIKLRKIFKNKDDAVRARLTAEVEYFGEFAPQQHLYEQYGITPQNDCINQTNTD